MFMGQDIVETVKKSVPEQLKISQVMSIMNTRQLHNSVQFTDIISIGREKNEKPMSGSGKKEVIPEKVGANKKISTLIRWN